MTGLAIGTGIGLIGGAWIRWAVRPVLFAFGLGRLFEQLRRQSAAHRAAREHASWN